MLRPLYRAMVISSAKSAAYQTLAMLSDRELADIGYSRVSFVDAYIANIVAELDANACSRSITCKRKLDWGRLIRPTLLFYFDTCRLVR